MLQLQKNINRKRGVKMIINIEKKENEKLTCRKLNLEDVKKIMSNRSKSYIENNFDISKDPIQFVLDNPCELSNEELNAISSELN